MCTRWSTKPKQGLQNSGLSNYLRRKRKIKQEPKEIHIAPHAEAEDRSIFLTELITESGRDSGDLRRIRFLWELV